MSFSTVSYRLDQMENDLVKCPPICPVSRLEAHFYSSTSVSALDSLEPEHIRLFQFEMCILGFLKHHRGFHAIVCYSFPG